MVNLLLVFKENIITTFTTEDRQYAQDNWEPPRKALTDEEINSIGFNLNYPFSILKIARAIELAHGIVQDGSIQTNKEPSNENS